MLVLRSILHASPLPVQCLCRLLPVVPVLLVLLPHSAQLAVPVRLLLLLRLVLQALVQLARQRLPLPLLHLTINYHPNQRVLFI